MTVAEVREVRNALTAPVPSVFFVSSLLAAKVVDVIAVLKNDLSFNSKQINAILNLARASGERKCWGILESSIYFRGNFRLLQEGWPAITLSTLRRSPMEALTSCGS
jgi:hypothetical protein